jgi:hypothetical protein
VAPGFRQRFPGGVGYVVVEALLVKAKIRIQTTPAMNPITPRTRPPIASPPPPTVPLLAVILPRETKPMIAAAGPSTTPSTQQTSERIPVTSYAIASPSVRWLAYCIPPPGM